METEQDTPGIIYGVSHAEEPHRIRYVGKTQRLLRVREKEHWADSRNRTRGAFGQWLKKHAHEPNRVRFRVLSLHTTLEELDGAEITTISKLKSQGQCDLNLAKGGPGTATGKEPAKPTPLRAEKHPMRKLNWEQVREIRQIRQEEFIPAHELAERYGLKNDWAIRNVLWNKTWFDPGFDPGLVVEYTNDYHSGEMGQHSRLTWGQVRELRDGARLRFEPREKLAKRYGVARGTVSFVLANKTWTDSSYDPGTLAPGPKRTRVLSWDRVREIREYYMDTGGTSKGVADRFELGRATTSLLLNNKTWKDDEYESWLGGKL